MSEIRDRDDLILTVNRLMICAMEDIDSGRNEASPTTLDLVQRIEDCDAALRLALETATRERDEARVALEKSRRTIYFTWRDVEACREGLSISADIKGDTLEEVVRFLLNERDDIATFIESASDAHARAAAAERERDEARQEAKRLMSLTQNWYEGRARIGSHMTFVDQRFYDSVRLQRTGWPGDDADGDGGPPEE